MTGLGAYFSQRQFSSFKSAKKIILAIDLPGIGAKTLTKYLNTGLDLKTWTSQFSSSKKGKTRETILLTISLTGVSFQVPKKEKPERQFF